VINNTIARRYAKALVQLASEGGMLDRFREELSSARALLRENIELASVFSNPAFTLEQKKEIMKGVAERMGASSHVSNFLMLIVDKSRVSLLDEIVRIYEKLADERSGIIRPLIRTAFPLDESQVESIRSVLQNKSGRKVMPDIVVDKTLIGGIVTQIGDIAYDCSLKTQLRNIQDILQKG